MKRTPGTRAKGGFPLPGILPTKTFSGRAPPQQPPQQWNGQLVDRSLTCMMDATHRKGTNRASSASRMSHTRSASSMVTLSANNDSIHGMTYSSGSRPARCTVHGGTDRVVTLLHTRLQARCTVHGGTDRAVTLLHTRLQGTGPWYQLRVATRM